MNSFLNLALGKSHKRAGQFSGIHGEIFAITLFLACNFFDDLFTFSIDFHSFGFCLADIILIDLELDIM